MMQFSLRNASLLLFILSIPSYLYSEQPGIIDSTEEYRVILRIEYLNDDSIRDTIIATADYNKNFKPKYIVWGKDTTDNGIPDSLKFDYTTIEYPYGNFQNLFITSNLNDLNSDTLLDIIIIYRATITDTTLGKRETACALVIFGNRGLDTVQTIIISDIDTFQIRPFVAMHMRKDHELKDPLIWNISYLPIYSVPDIDVDVKDTSQIPPPITSTMIDQGKGPGLKVYPNPAIYYTNIELSNIMPGEYQVQIIDIKSIVLYEQKMVTDVPGDLIKKIDLTDIPTGSYILRLTSNNVVIGVYRIVIVK